MTEVPFQRRGYSTDDGRSVAEYGREVRGVVDGT